MTRNESIDGLDVNKPAPNSAVVAKQISLLLSNRGDLPINLINAAIVSYAFRHIYAGWVVLLWLGIFCCVILARTVIRHHYRKTSSDAKNVLIWGRRFALNAGATGCLWGLTGSVVLLTPNPMFHVFIVFVLGGMMAGGIVSNSAYMPAAYGFMVPTILPVIAVLFSRADLMHIEMAVMLAVFAVVLILTGQNINRSIIETFRLRINQDVILEKMRASEAMLAKSQEIAQVGSWEIDLLNNSYVCSVEAYRIFGIDPAKPRASYEEMMARIHPGDRTMVAEDIARTVSGGPGLGLDHRLVMDDGSIKYVHELAQATCDASDRPVRLTGTVQDITASRAAEENLKYANLLLKTQVESSPDGIVVIDAKQKISLSNQRFNEIWKIPSAIVTSGDYEGALKAGIALVKDAPNFSALMQEITNDPSAIIHDQFEMKDGRFIDRYTVPLITADRVHLGRIWFFRDITESRSAEEDLKFANILLKTEMEASRDGMIVVDANQKIILSNQRFSEIWKTPEATLNAGRDGGVLAAGTAHVKDPEKFSARVQELYDDPAASGDDEFEMMDGRFIDRHTVPLTTADEVYLGRIWFFRDITEAKQAAAHALRLARFDELTGLPNRSVFVEALNQAITRAKRDQSGFAVIYLDLDHFKDVNDTMGHAAGDTLLQAVADRLRSNTRASDTVARFGGDEFAIVVTDVADPAVVAILADKLIDVLRKPYWKGENIIFSGASIGIDLYGPEAPDAETLLSHADVALYRAKAEGRSGYRFFTEAMDAEVRMQVSMGSELHKALDAGQFFLLYQPQVEVDSARMTGVEALVRWRHPKRGILGPGIFIPIAEKTGTIIELGNWVIQTACRQGKAWLEAGLPPIRIAVNLSALQFRSPVALETEIGKILAESGLPPKFLELELTETVLMKVDREQSNILQRLRYIGVTIAIDDFGAGYSSLDYLRRFSPDRIKVAQNFVEHIESMPGDAAIVKATIGLARELGINVIAEGVETKQQFEMLKSWNCEEAQGFYFAKPLVVEEVALLLQRGGILQPGAGSIP